MKSGRMTMIGLVTAGWLLVPQCVFAGAEPMATSAGLDLSTAMNVTSLYSTASFGQAVGDAPAEAAAPATNTVMPGEEGWWLAPSLALWLPGLSGTVGVRGRTTNVDASFIDVLQDSDSLIGIMGTLDFGYGRLGGYVSGAYMKIGAEEGLENRVDATLELALLEFGVSYDLLRLPMGWTATAEKPARDFAAQLRVGGRYTALDIDLSFPDIGNRSRSEGWVDPMIGARFQFPFSQDWSFVINGSIGGFGAASQLAWSAGGMFSWDFTIGQFPSSLQFGYLAIGDDYTTGSGADQFVWDTVLQGPVLNWVVRF